MAYVDEVRADNPTAYWRLGEASGTAAQEDDNLYDGTYQNTPTLGVAGALRPPATPTRRLPSRRRRSRRSASPTTPPCARQAGPYSIEFWIKRNGNPAASEYLIAKPGGGTAGSWTVQLPELRGGTPTPQRRERSSSSIATVTNNAWHHVVFSVTSECCVLRLHRWRAERHGDRACLHADRRGHARRSARGSLAALTTAG